MPVDISVPLNDLHVVRSRKFFSQEYLTAFGNSITASVFNFALWFTNKSNGQIVYFSNKGVSGDTSQMMLDRISSIDQQTTIVTVMEATNDAGNGVAPLTHAQNMRTIAETLISAGYRVIFLLAPPKDSSLQTPDIEKMNLYDYITAQRLGIECYNVWDNFADAVDGQWLSGAASDGIHPTSLTQKVAGEDLFVKFSNKQFAVPLPRNNSDSSGLMTNNCFLTDGNADGTPDGWTTYGGGTRSLQSTLLGKKLTLSDVGSTAVYIQQTTSGAAVVAGKQYLITMLASGTVSGTNAMATIYISTPDGEKYAVRESPASFDERIVTFVYTPTVNGNVQVGLRITGTDHNCSISISRLNAYCLTDYTLPGL